MSGTSRTGNELGVRGEIQPPETAVDGSQTAQSIGAYLRGQRELRGIEIADLAALTRIPLRSLERLESGCFDGEVDGFVRGFVRTVGDGLGLDPDDTLGRMLSEPAPESGTRPDLSTRLLRASLAIALLAVLALGALGFREWWWPGGGAAPPSLSEELVPRRDPVRALADAQAAAAGSPSLPDLRPPASVTSGAGDESPWLQPARP